MTNAELLSVLERGADRLAQLPEAQQEHALAELRSTTHEIAKAYGFTLEDGVAFAEDLIEALRTMTACRRSSALRVLH